MKKILIGLTLLSTLAFADRVKIIEDSSYHDLERSVNTFIVDKNVKNISISMSSSNNGMKVMWYTACIHYED